MKRLLLALCLWFVVAPAHAERERLTAQEAYELGQRYVKRGYYVKALEQFNRVRTYFRDDPYALKAELAIADMSFKKNEWDAARLAYEGFMRAHPRYPELDYVLWRLGECMEKKAPTVAAKDQTWTRQAVTTWTGFLARYPESTYGDEVQRSLTRARNRLARKELLIARFYAQRRAWPAVASRAEGLLRDFPDSPDRAEALALLGVAYVGTDRVDDARAALDRLRSEAPDHPGVRKLESVIAHGAPAPRRY